MYEPPNVKAKSHNLGNSNPHFPCIFMPLGEGAKSGVYCTYEHSDSGLKYQVHSDQKPMKTFSELLN